MFSVENGAVIQAMKRMGGERRDIVVLAPEVDKVNRQDSMTNVTSRSVPSAGFV